MRPHEQARLMNRQNGCNADARNGAEGQSQPYGEPDQDCALPPWLGPRGQRQWGCARCYSASLMAYSITAPITLIVSSPGQLGQYARTQYE